MFLKQELNMCLNTQLNMQNNKESNISQSPNKLKKSNTNQFKKASFVPPLKNQQKSSQKTNKSLALKPKFKFNNHKLLSITLKLLFNTLNNLSSTLLVINNIHIMYKDPEELLSNKDKLKLNKVIENHLQALIDLIKNDDD